MPKVKKSAIFILIASYIFALFGGWELPYVAFYMIIGTFIISFLWCRHVSKRILVYQRVEKKDYHVGEVLEIKSFVDNDTLFSVPHLEIVDNTQEIFNFNKGDITITSLLPTEREIIDRRVSTKYRGIHDIGPVDLIVSDAFGIFGFKRRFYSDTSIKVYPRVFNLKKFDLESMQSYGTVSTKQRTYEDNTSVSDIKKYCPGDSIKKVHWKVSAKKRALFVKNYEMTGSASVYLFLDFNMNSFKGENSRDLEERAIEASASIISYMLNNAITVNMFVNAYTPYYIKGRDIKEIGKFLDVLCEVKPNGNKTMREVIEKRIKLISRGASVVIVTGNIGIDDSKVYCGINKMGYDVIIIYSGEYAIEKEAESMMDSCNIKRYYIRANSDIKGVLEEI